MKEHLNALFCPNNIAVVGASGNPAKAGYTILKNLTGIGYSGAIFPVNQSEAEILGLPCSRSLSQIKDTIEMVVLIAPAAKIFDIMDDLELRMKEKADVKVIVCAAADYGETKTAEGIKRQNCLMGTAKRWGIRVVGPNCIGVIDNVNRIDTTFVETHLPRKERVKCGGISFISQSGAMAASILMMGDSRPVPVAMNKFISIGNMADVDFIDLLEYFETDEDTKVIGMYMEGYPQGRLLIETLARIARKKPVVVLKVGRSAMGAAAANSHTGSLAGADAVYDAAFRQYGIIRAQTMEEMLNTLRALDAMTLPEGNRTFVYSQAGGPGIYCMDAYMEAGAMELPIIHPQTRQRLLDILPAMANTCSPEGYADITASANVEQHVEGLRALMDDSAVDAVIFITVVPTFLSRKALGEALKGLLQDEGYIRKKPVYLCIMAGSYVNEVRSILEGSGIPTFDTPADCVKTANHIAVYQRFLQKEAVGDEPQLK